LNADLGGEPGGGLTNCLAPILFLLYIQFKVYLKRHGKNTNKNVHVHIIKPKYNDTSCCCLEHGYVVLHKIATGIITIPPIRISHKVRGIRGHFRKNRSNLLLSSFRHSCIFNKLLKG